MNDRAIVYRRKYNIPTEWGTAVNVQAMVYGNTGENSGSGVAFTRNPANGVKEFYGEFLINAQGEDVVAGVRTPEPVAELKKQMPKAYAELERIRQTLEKHFKDVQDFEFTIEDGVVYMLQTRNGKRTAMAALKFSIDMQKEKLIDWKTAILRNPADQLEQLLAPVFDLTEVAKAKAIATGLPAGPGAASGQIYLNADRAVVAADKGEKVLLVRVETSPEDLRGMIAAEGILTARGGVSSHAALVARQMGKVCVCGAAAVEVDYQARTVKVDGQTFKEGDWMSIDGTIGRVYAGQVKTAPSEIVAGLIDGDEAAKKTEKFQQLPAADEVVLGRDPHESSAPTPTRRSRPRTRVAFGAVGIGLTRTEHMFFEGDRIDAMREMILAETLEERKAALAKLLPYQREDFAGIFRALKGYPATIRFLDPPLHEFLPHTKQQQEELAKKIGVPAARIHQRVEQLHEFNPMLGFRGCRLGIGYPEISAMQARAVFEAAAIVQKEGIKVRPGDHDPAGRLQEGAGPADRGRPPGGPRGPGREEGQAQLHGRHDDRDPARRADRRRDRAVGRVLQLRHQRPDADRPRHVARRLGLVPAAVSGAGDRQEEPVRDDRRQRRRAAGRDRGDQGPRRAPGIKLGICGEHGGDPASIHFFEKVGLDYVSCSPYRVPVARLAAAQAALQAKTSWSIASLRVARDQGLQARGRSHHPGRRCRPGVAAAGQQGPGVGRSRSAHPGGGPHPHRCLPLPRAGGGRRAGRTPSPEARILRRLSLPDPARHRLPGERARVPYPGRRFLRQRPLPGHGASTACPARSARSATSAPATISCSAKGRRSCCTASSTRWSTTIARRWTKLQDRLDQLEKEVFEHPQPDLARRIIDFKRDVSSLRHVVQPQRDVVGRLARREFPLISEQLGYRFRDVYDHLVRLTDESMFFGDRITSLLDAHLSTVSNQLNSVMKILTVIATIFMPLTFITGLYGMNVDLPHFGLGADAVLLGPAGHHAGHLARHAGVLPHAPLDLGGVADGTGTRESGLGGRQQASFSDEP